MTIHKKTKSHFSTEFKLEAVEQVVVHQQKPIDVAQALDIDPSTVRKWVRQYQGELQGITPKSSALTAEQREIQSLQAQVKRLEMEKDILKQAAVLMGELSASRSSHGSKRNGRS